MDKKRIEEIALKKASDFIIDAVGEGNLINFVIDVIEAVQGEAVPVGYIDAKDLAKSGNSRIIAKCLGPYAGLTTPVFTAPPAALPPAYIFDQASGSVALASAPAEWMPIETAPKDGTEVLVVWWGKVVMAWCAGAGASRDGGDWWRSHSLHVVSADHPRPTHWMPLPPAPEVK